ncbi:nucleotide exchange factor SIL1 [Notothenia coriiceps]|uniref:Nucleotide exchange factor SIL1 n=1 Tax=Notothenia coriiceps TaxID=8208 RepID=A0A6I9P6C9_9TELE|nr:PREDICTED: nucleotide exchange factor SIL1 [Notothenia coriiceps]
MQLVPSRSAAPLSSLALFLLLCCHMTSTLSQKSGSALAVVENTEGEVEVTDVGDEGDFEVVQPTEEWQTLKPGQAVPAGSHVRLNLQTGQREVRLGEEQLKYLDQEHRETEETSISPEELKRVMKKIKEDIKPESAEHQDSVASRFRPMEELKREMDELDLLVQTDDQIMRRLLEQFNSSSSTTEQRLSILLELEYLVHQVDNAQNLCSMGGLQLVVETLNSSDFRLQESSAFVLGSAVSSNPEVQVKAMEGGALQTLLTMLATDQPLWVKKKVLFAVASLLRNFPFAQRHFLSRGGLQVLSELFRGDRGGVLRTRIVTMLYDMISEKELISQAGLDPGLHASHQELLRQYSLVSLREGLLEEGWCSLIPELLDSTEHDFREKALRAMLALAPVCVDQYRSHSSLKASLLLLREQYQDMIQSQMILGEENEYFEEMMDLINALHVKLR